MRRVLLDGALVIAPRPGCVLVHHVRNIDTTELVEATMNAVDAALEDWNLDRAIFDTREIDNGAPEHVATLWRWLATHPRLVRVASIVHAKEVAERINLRSVTEGVKIRAFHRVPAAERWVTLMR